MVKNFGGGNLAWLAADFSLLVFGIMSMAIHYFAQSFCGCQYIKLGIENTGVDIWGFHINLMSLDAIVFILVTAD